MKRAGKDTSHDPRNRNGLRRLEHDPKKWESVFGKDHDPTRMREIANTRIDLLPWSN
jgi:hypothetical protein